jgi:hypothetical protein
MGNRRKQVMVIHVKIIGSMLVVLALVHIIFPRYFQWQKELQMLSLANRQIMKVHTFFIALTLFLMGSLCLSSAVELTETDLGKRLCLGLGVFWSVRLFIQFFGYSAKLWWGKPFETTVHIVFSALWIYFSMIFIWIAIV